MANTLKKIIAAGGRDLFGRIQFFLDEPPKAAQNCDKVVMNFIYSHLKQLVNTPGFLDHHYNSVSVLLQLVQQLSSYEQHQDGLHKLLDSGLLDMLSEVLVTSLHCIRGSPENNGAATKFYEDSIETIITIGDYSTRVKVATTEKFCDRFLQIVNARSFSFSTRIEAVKSTNLLLEGCPLVVRERLKELTHHNDLVCSTGMLIEKVGDYEFQVALLECLFRLVSKANREESAMSWFSKEEFLTAFLEVRDSEFETDCRTFLNIVNAEPSSEFCIHSFPCDKVYLGHFELHKPTDDSYDEFWVDFNTGSNRMTLFCCQELPDSQPEDEMMWETVSVWDHNVMKFNVLESCLGTAVQFMLKAPAHDLITFGPTSDERLCEITFVPGISVVEAIQQTFGSEKMHGGANRKISQVIEPIPILMKDEEDMMEPLEGPVARPKERFMPLSQETIASRNTSQRSSGTPRMKVSVPCVPMRISPYVPGTPNSVHEAVPSVAQPSSAPKTPVSSNSNVKRVKTPLQIVGGDSIDDSKSPQEEKSSKAKRGRRTKAAKCKLEESNVPKVQQNEVESSSAEEQEKHISESKTRSKLDQKNIIEEHSQIEVVSNESKSKSGCSKIETSKSRKRNRKPSDEIEVIEESQEIQSDHEKATQRRSKSNEQRSEAKSTVFPKSKTGVEIEVIEESQEIQSDPEKATQRRSKSKEQRPEAKSTGCLKSKTGDEFGVIEVLQSVPEKPTQRRSKSKKQRSEAKSTGCPKSKTVDSEDIDCIEESQDVSTKPIVSSKEAKRLVGAEITSSAKEPIKSSENKSKKKAILDNFGFSDDVEVNEETVEDNEKDNKKRSQKWKPLATKRKNQSTTRSDHDGSGCQMEIVPSSCPDEFSGVITESEALPELVNTEDVPESQVIPVYGNGDKARSFSDQEESAKETEDETSLIIEDHKENSKSRSKRKEKMREMKERITSNDPKYQPLSLNSVKVSRTPALSAVSEEEKTPSATSGILSQKLDAIEEVAVVEDNPKVTIHVPQYEVQNPLMSPDSTSDVKKNSRKPRGRSRTMDTTQDNVGDRAQKRQLPKRGAKSASKSIIEIESDDNSVTASPQIEIIEDKDPAVSDTSAIEEIVVIESGPKKNKRYRESICDVTIDSKDINDSEIMNEPKPHQVETKDKKATLKRSRKTRGIDKNSKTFSEKEPDVDIYETKMNNIETIPSKDISIVADNFDSPVIEVTDGKPTNTSQNASFEIINNWSMPIKKGNPKEVEKSISVESPSLSPIHTPLENNDKNKSTAKADTLPESVIEPEVQDVMPVSLTQDIIIDSQAIPCGQPIKHKSTSKEGDGSSEVSDDPNSSPVQELSTFEDLPKRTKKPENKFTYSKQKAIRQNKPHKKSTRKSKTEEDLDTNGIHLVSPSFRIESPLKVGDPYMFNTKQKKPEQTSIRKFVQVKGPLDTSSRDPFGFDGSPDVSKVGRNPKLIHEKAPSSQSKFFKHREKVRAAERSVQKHTEAPTQAKPRKSDKVAKKSLSKSKKSINENVESFMEEFSKDDDGVEIEQFNSNENQEPTVDCDADVSASFDEDCVTNFANICKNLVKQSSMRGESSKEKSRATKKVNYKEASESDTDLSHHEADLQERLSSPAEDDNCTPIMPKVSGRKKDKKNIFSDNSLGESGKSGVSWCGSTARKKANVRPTYSYLNYCKKKTQHGKENVTGPFSDSDSEPVPLKSTKKRPLKQPQQKKSMLTNQSRQSKSRPMSQSDSEPEVPQKKKPMKTKKKAQPKEDDEFDTTMCHNPYITDSENEIVESKVINAVKQKANLTETSIKKPMAKDTKQKSKLITKESLAFDANEIAVSKGKKKRSDRKNKQNTDENAPPVRPPCNSAVDNLKRKPFRELQNISGNSASPLTPVLGNRSIEMPRFEECLQCPTPYMVQISPDIVPVHKRKSSEESEDLLDLNDDPIASVFNETNDDAMSQVSIAYTHISTLQTPKTPARSRDQDVDEESEGKTKETSEEETSGGEPSEIECEQERVPRRRNSKRCSEEAVTGIKSGPTKRRKVERESNSEVNVQTDFLSDKKGSTERKKKTKGDLLIEHYANQFAQIASMGENVTLDLNETPFDKSNPSSGISSLEESQLRPRQLFPLNTPCLAKPLNEGVASDNDSQNCDEEEEEEAEENTGMGGFGGLRMHNFTFSGMPSMPSRKEHQDDLDMSLNAGVTGLLSTFGTDIMRNMMAKKQNLEAITKSTMKTTNKQILSIWNKQQTRRQNIYSVLEKKVVNEVTGLEEDAKCTQNAQDKLMALVEKQNIILDHTRKSQAVRIKRLQNLSVNYIEEIKTEENQQFEEQSQVMKVLEKGMGTLKKKVHQQSNKQEMSNVKRALHSLIM